MISIHVLLIYYHCQIWWFIAVYTTDLYVLYFGRFLSGIYAGGTYALVPLYVAEISQDKVRGSLGSFFIFGLDVGMLMIYVFGAYLSYETVQITFLCIMAVFMVILAFLPDTPISLMRRGKPEAAADAMKFFRGLRKDEMINGDISLEIQLMKMKIDENAKTHRGLRNLLDATSIKAILFGTFLTSFHQFSGVTTFVGYAADIFRESGSSFTPNASAVIVGVLLNVGALISVFVMDKFTRKLLYFITNMGNIFGLVLMGFYGFFGQFYDVNDFKIIPVIALSIVILFVSIARLPLTYVITAEIQPQRTRSFGIAICSSVSWFCAFLMMKYFASLVDLITFHNCMFLFAFVLVISQVFVTFLVPETKNKSFEEIERDMK